MESIGSQKGPGPGIDVRFWTRSCASVMLVFSVILFGVIANELRLLNTSHAQVAESHAIIMSLPFNDSSPEFISLPFEKWSDLNIQLSSVTIRWESQVASLIAALTIMCICFIVELAIVLLPLTHKRGEQFFLLPKDNRSSTGSLGQVASALLSGEPAKKSSAMMCEGPLYEPWNQATLDKLSGEDSPAATKITRGIYRYGPIAGKILLRRYGHMLTENEVIEIERILNFGQHRG